MILFMNHVYIKYTKKTSASVLLFPAGCQKHTPWIKNGNKSEIFLIYIIFGK